MVACCSGKGVICKFLTMRSRSKAQNKVDGARFYREAAVNWLVLHRMRFITGARGIFLFIQSLLKSPLAVGAVVPSSPQLSRLTASQVGCGSSHVLEVGAGTGSITDALLSLGLPANRLFVIERDPSLVAHLHSRFRTSESAAAMQSMPEATLPGSFLTR